MAEGMNKAILIGNLGADPEVRAAGQTTVCKLRLATTTRYKDASGAWKDQTEWHEVNVWGARGNALGGILTKGSRVCVEGEIRTRSWETPAGEKRYATSIHASNVLLLDGKASSQTRAAEDDPFAAPRAPATSARGPQPREPAEEWDR